MFRWRWTEFGENRSISNHLTCWYLLNAYRSCTLIRLYIYIFSFSFLLKRCKRDVVINVYTFVRRNPKDRKRTMAFSIACICCTRTVSKPNHINYESSYQFTNTKLRSTVFLKCTYYQSCTIGLLIDSRLNFISWGEGGRKKREIVRNIGR